MTNSMHFVGLDVHASATQAAVFEPESGEVAYRKIQGRPDRVIEFLEGVPKPFRAVYEAGPTGYGLARRAAGLAVEICAPGHILRRPQDRIKTDKRDAIRLARLLAAGELRPVRLPSVAEEQFRDLVRAREDVRVDLMRARHRLSKLLLRRELYHPGKGNAWTQPHREWLDSLRFEDRPTTVVFTDYLEATDLLVNRRDRLERELAELVEDSPWTVLIANLRCLRGIDTLSATGICAEVGEFGRFSPDQLASYLGLVPSEESSGPERRQGSITKAGSKHARRLLVEAAWHYRHRPHVSNHLRRRQHGADPRAVQVAWAAQRRLHGRWHQLHERRGKAKNKVAVAVARELSGFCWEVADLD